MRTRPGPGVGPNWLMPTPTQPNPGRPPHQPDVGLPGAPAPTIWHADAPQQPQTLSGQLARRVLDELTSHGDIVIDIVIDPALAHPATESGRHHHSLGGHDQLATLSRVAGYVDLVLLHWPRPPANPRFLLTGCRALLRPPGSLVVAVCVPAADRVAHLTALLAAAPPAPPSQSHTPTSHRTPRRQRCPPAGEGRPQPPQRHRPHSPRPDGQRF